MSHQKEASLPQYTLYGPAFKANPYPVLAALRGVGPVYPQPARAGAKKVWYVTRHKEARLVLRDHKRFVSDIRNTLTPEEKANQTSAPGLGRYLRAHLMRRDADEHRRLRTLLHPVFHKRAVASRGPRIEQLANDLLDRVEPQGRMDLIEDFAFPLAFQVIVEILGFPADQIPHLRLWTEAAIHSPYSPLSPQERLTAQRAYLDYVQSCFEARKTRPQEDVLTHLVRAVQKGQLQKEEFFSMVTIVLIAGHETTVRMIGNAVLALLQHPEQCTMLKHHPARLQRAIEELLRYDGSVERVTTRFAAEDLALGGYKIGRGDAVRVLLTSANRDERSIANPDHLNVGRSACPHLSFGLGPHYCVGASLARLELEIAIRTVLQRLPGLRLAVPVQSLQWVLLSAVRGLCALPVVWE